MRGLDARRSEAALRRVACAVIGLVFPDRWVWDFWLVRDGADHHVFYLQAPSDSASPDGRHWHASIGHAVSSDLTNWQVLGDALRPGPPGSWDDASTWTGSVVPVDGGWAMLYTGISTAERGLVQRIELARSTDLLHWDKHGGPVLEADARWYELYDTADPAGSAAAVPRPWRDQAWRHPWVYPDGNGRWQAVLTARAGTGDPAERGVVGQARSADLLHWEVLPLLTPPRSGFGQMEVPQLLERGGRTYLIFCSDTETQAPDAGRGPGPAPTTSCRIRLPGLSRWWAAECWRPTTAARPTPASCTRPPKAGWCSWLGTGPGATARSTERSATLGRCR